jgi:hypothetical protein
MNEDLKEDTLCSNRMKGVNREFAEGMEGMQQERRSHRKEPLESVVSMSIIVCINVPTSLFVITDCPTGPLFMEIIVQNSGLNINDPCSIHNSIVHPRTVYFMGRAKMAFLKSMALHYIDTFCCSASITLRENLLRRRMDGP